MFDIPTVGFGPSEEKYAHTPEDRCPIDHLVHSAAFYASIPWVIDSLRNKKKQGKSGQKG